MKDIRECFEDTRDIVDLISESRIDEGLKDFLNVIKDKFKKAWVYLKGVVVQFGTYFLPVNDEGEVEPAISPLTAGAAYKSGNINKDNTLVVMDKEGARITGCRTKYKDGEKLYGSGNSIKYWERMITESVKEETPINEVKMHTEDPEAKYNIIVDNKELQDEIERCIKNPKRARLMIWGAPGIGKTAILMNVVKSIQKTVPDYQFIFKTLSNETPDNFTLPTYVEVDGQRKADDIPKTWLPVYKPSGNEMKDKMLDEKCGKGLLFIDELSRATPQVQNVILPLINEGKFNGNNLGSGWSIVCASNRAEDEVSGQTTIGSALGNRFLQVYYEPCVNSWRDWADKQNFISPLLLQWLSLPESEELSGGKYFYMDPNEEYENASSSTLMCTPRSWTNAMRVLAEYSHTGTLEGFSIFDIPTRIIARALNMAIPASAVDSFLAFLSVVQSIGDFDRAVYEVWKNGGKNFKIKKQDMMKISLPVAQLICTAHSKELPSGEEFKSLCNWLIDQNSDQLTSYTLDVFKNVFLASLPDSLRDKAMVIPLKLSKSPDESTKALMSSVFAPFLKAWNITLEEVPDYYPGLAALNKKYGEIFRSTVIDGKDGLD